MGTTTKRETCADRLPAALAGRLDDLRDLTARMSSDDDDEREEAYEEAHHYGLSIDGAVTFRWQISTGGPGDEFLVTVQDGEITEIRYRFLDWWDGATKTLAGSEFDAVEEFFHHEFGYMLDDPTAYI